MLISTYKFFTQSGEKITNKIKQIVNVILSDVSKEQFFIHSWESIALPFVFKHLYGSNYLQLTEIVAFQVAGVLLKLSVHGLAQTRDRLETLVERWTQPADADPQVRRQSCEQVWF